MQRKVNCMKRSCGMLIKQLHDCLEKDTNNKLRDQDLTMAQGGALIELHNVEEKQLTLKELERRMHVAQSTAAGIVVRLEQKGLVESFGDPADRRIKMVRMTPKGEACCREADKNMEQTEHRLLQPLTKEEQKTLLDLLGKVCDGMQ